ncbi:uncharacterized protein NPIL_99641 [Nephila pilipes]|uniref:Uncharacterized protein n=1 Tax=Nephila pilipes TaxID=299642 RepID=A0A8X6Q9K2_NEPPI|nr:uncharacterized protein NPIL_525211 [Nephila pilipes]GFU14112.1 uncharacterized protein NPIL_99641 [Nephila pilipes]
MAERERRVTVPLMVRYVDDIQFVEDDNDTVSETEHSSEITTLFFFLSLSAFCSNVLFILRPIGTKNFTNLDGNVYCEIPAKETKVEFLDIPRFLHSRSNSTPSNSSAQTSPMLERKSSYRKKSNHDYEKLSVTSNSSKKSTVERIAESTFFRRRAETSHEKKIEQRGEEEEHVLEVLRQVVRKCTTVDPVKRPSSTDINDLLSSLNEKS